jgi:hypothetical protein
MTEEKKQQMSADVRALKVKLGLDKIHPDLHWRERLKKLIDEDKYYLVECHSIPYKGSTILKRSIHPSHIIQDLGYKITREQWEYYNELARKGEYINERKGIWEL